MIGTVVAGRYRIDSVLGTGGMGTVYKAQQLNLNRSVAIKVLKAAEGDDELDRLMRFNQEARLVGLLDHPNIIRALDFGIDDGKAFLVLEYAEGQCLDELLIKNGRLSWSRALHIFIQLSEALGYAHMKEIIHRDIKPSNVMLVSDSDGREQVKVLDFGVAKILNAQQQAPTPVTKTGLVFGSPPYMSPEQCSGSAPDSRSDIYSLGCVMYEALTGRQPISGENSLEILHKQIISEPMQFNELSPPVQVPRGFETIVFHALDKDPECRYQSMFELRDDLLKLQANQTFVPKLPPQPVNTVLPIGDTRTASIGGIILILATVSLVAFVSPKDVLGRNSPTPGKPMPRQSRPTLEEQALARAVLNLARTLESSGKGKQAESELKALLQREEQMLPEDDPAIQDIMRVEATLEADEAARKK